jgi:hypothetical protein
LLFCKFVSMHNLNCCRMVHSFQLNFRLVIKIKHSNNETLESPANNIYHKYILEFKLKVINQTKMSRIFLCDNYSREESIQGRKLLNNRRFWLRKLFKGGKYSREETIRGNTVCTFKF